MKENDMKETRISISISGFVGDPKELAKELAKAFRKELDYSDDLTNEEVLDILDGGDLAVETAEAAVTRVQSRADSDGRIAMRDQVALHLELNGLRFQARRVRELPLWGNDE